MKLQQIIFQIPAASSDRADMPQPHPVTDEPTRMPMRSILRADDPSSHAPQQERENEGNRKKSSQDSDSTAQEKLLQLASKSNQVLLQVKTVFPFDFFPTEVVIDELKVTIINRYFFGSEQIQSMEIRDITQVQVETSPWLASLKITHRSGELYRIPNLTKHDAIEAHRILQGLMIGERQHIEFTDVQPNVLKQSLQDIGKGKEDSTI